MRRSKPGSTAHLNAVAWLLAGAVALSACTRVEFENTEDRLRRLPGEVAGQGEALRGSTVVWGGRILEIENLGAETELLVLGLPLSSGNVPQTDETSVGRFVIRVDGFLEPEDFAPGRYVTAAGVLDGDTDTWQYEGLAVDLPRVLSGRLHLWPRDLSTWRERVNIGFSISIHN